MSSGVLLFTTYLCPADRLSASFVDCDVYSAFILYTPAAEGVHVVFEVPDTSFSVMLSFCPVLVFVMTNVTVPAGTCALLLTFAARSIEPSSSPISSDISASVVIVGSLSMMTIFAVSEIIDLVIP